MQRGAFIVVEGLDKAGKSTQCTRLVTELEQRGIQTRHLRFPDRTTPIGETIDRYLKGQIYLNDHAIHLLFSANRWEAAAFIREEVASGVTVIADRYHYSGCVYSVAKGVPGLDLNWASWPEVGLPCPDKCIFLDVSSADAQKRSDYGSERYEDSETQTRVRGLFEKMRLAEPGRFTVVDAGQHEALVTKEVLDAVMDQLVRIQSASGNAPLQAVQHISSLG